MQRISKRLLRAKSVLFVNISECLKVDIYGLMTRLNGFAEIDKVPVSFLVVDRFGIIIIIEPNGFGHPLSGMIVINEM